jgi:hypothetical protein
MRPDEINYVIDDNDCADNSKPSAQRVKRYEPEF